MQPQPQLQPQQRQAAAFARARAADNYGAFRALDAIGRDAIASTSIADVWVAMASRAYAKGSLQFFAYTVGS